MDWTLEPNNPSENALFFINNNSQLVVVCGATREHSQFKSKIKNVRANDHGDRRYFQWQQCKEY